MKQVRRFLMIGAHPDDADICFGGTAVQLVRAGHHVKFVAMCNGDCGHYAMSGRELAERRYREAQASRAISGIDEYQIFLENGDCELEADVEQRKKVIRLIRAYKPDVVLSHRLCDYHADHRAAAQLVQDAAYLTQVPQYCGDTPIPEENPVFGCVYDRFTDPRPFRPDALVPFDDAADEKCRLLDCHVSQVYEWLAWEKKLSFDHTKWTWEEKKAYLLENWGKRFAEAADLGRQALIETYGEAGRTVHYAEAFELSPYGRKVTVAEFRELMRP